MFPNKLKLIIIICNQMSMKHSLKEFFNNKDNNFRLKNNKNKNKKANQIIKIIQTSVPNVQS